MYSCCRSLAACEQLSRAGYGEIAWINGGFDTARKEDLPVVGAPDLRYGGIGGLSEFLGWTDAQRQNSKTEGFIGGFQNVLKLVSIMVGIGSKYALPLPCNSFSRQGNVLHTMWKQILAALQTSA